MLRVGLTGGIACGKSHVLRRLAASGLPTLDLDAVSRDVVAPGSPALAEIASAFGPSVSGSGGGLDRAALATIVFADPSARARLNAIVHPRVRAAEAEWAALRAAAGEAVAVTDAALIVETGAHLRFDRIVVVHCAPEQQLARLRARDGLDEPAARARVAAQMPVDEKRAFAHFEVDTSGTVADTEARAEALARELREIARRPLAPPPSLGRLEAVVAAGPPEGPRGLGPLGLLDAAAEAGGLDMEALAARLVPRGEGSWLAVARVAAPGGPAAALGPALVAWALARGPADADFLVSAAGSLARLTHEDAGERSAACLYALVMHDALVAGRRPDEAAAGRAPLAVRWGGAPLPSWTADVWALARAGGSAGGAAAVRTAETLAAALVAAGRPAAASSGGSVAAALRRVASARR